MASSTIEIHFTTNVIFNHTAGVVLINAVVTNSIEQIKHTANTMANSKLIGFSLILMQFCAIIFAQNAGDTLILVDNLAIRETHSIFFKGLQGKFICRSIKTTYDMTRLTCQLSLHPNYFD